MTFTSVAEDNFVAANTDEAITRGSSNVFADLGFENPEEELLKAKLVLTITDRIHHLGLSQTKAAGILGVSQPDVSKLLRGRTGGYSLERLFGFIRALGHDVEINVKAPTVVRPGRMRLQMPKPV